MTDVFVSYKAEDRRRVRPLVEALEADGYSVWWDEQIGGGAAWRQAIEAELNIAKCVIVAWSKRSVGPEGTFVQDEATRAQQRRVYVPVTIDKVHVPLGFGEMQALSLTGWKGDRSDARYQAVLAAVRRIAGDTAEPVPHGLARTAVSRRAVVGGGAVAAVAIAGGGAWMLLKPGSSASDRIAVLPFANLSGDAEQAYFADGLAEELRSALSRLGNLKVIGRVSSEAVRDAAATEAARKLQVGSLLTGSVRRSPSMIRVSAELVDGNDGAQRWSETYDRSPGDALAVQTDIAAKVAGALSIHLGQAERDALAVGGTKNAAAQDLYLKAQALSRSDQSEAALRRAIGLLDAAIALDARFGNAHAKKASHITNLTSSFANNVAALETGYTQAEVSARQAIAISPKLALGYVALGDIASARLDLTTALAMHDRALSFSPRDREALSSSARMFSDIGQAERALKLSDQILALDPLDPGSYSQRALFLFNARRYAEAIGFARRSLQFSPKRYIARTRVGDSLVMLGKPREALAEYSQVPADDPWRLLGEAIAHYRLGNRARSDQAFSELVAGHGDAFSFQQAEIHAQRAEPDRAFVALRRALEVRDPGLNSIRVDPFLDPIRSDPRFASIEGALRLP